MAITTIKTRSSNRSGKPCLPFAFTVAAAAILVAPVAGAADWKVVPTLTMRGTYSDNIRLAPRGLEESDFVTEISPGLSITGNGPNLKFKAAYAFQHLNYANDNKGDSSFHKLDAAAQVHLIKDLLSIDGSAAINQQDIDLFGPSTITSGIHTVNPNRTTVRTATISPYLHHHWRGIAAGELRYTKTQVSTTSQTLSDSDIDAVTLSVTSDPLSRTLAWGLRHDARRTARANTNSIDSKISTADARYMLTPQFYLTASGGYEDFDYLVAPGAEDPKGTFYSGGFSWNPTTRTNLALSVGKHFYGTTYTLQSSVRSRYTLWRVTYDESVTNTPEQIALNSTGSTADFLDQLFQSSIPDPALRQQMVERFIAANGLPTSLTRTINYLTTQFYLQKALRASVAVTGAKNSVLFTVSNVMRSPQSVDTVSITAADTRQLGSSVLWNWRFSGRTSANFGADHIRKKLQTTNAQERMTTYRVGLAHQFHSKLTGVVELKHAETASDTGLSNYQENAISAFVSMQF
ncbi:TIGR03016 family PEP-CTERM system-associated outer membrane protein [Noviherbaspirillum sp. ST9]|uniref:TIGR03016 family PEP-CTERM system-associated outer membrane protein n=1 Tax=Noviherbaspirillum sp. ST9 TaxID=3401606 RepID=UPI003B588F6C